MCRVGTDETNTDNIVFQNFTLNDNTNPEFQDFAVLAANQFIVRRSKEDMILADFDYWSDA